MGYGKKICQTATLICSLKNSWSKHNPIQAENVFAIWAHLDQDLMMLKVWCNLAAH